MTERTIRRGARLPFLRDYPSWRLLRPQPRWRSVLALVVSQGAIAAATSIIGVLMIGWGVFFLKPLDLSLVDGLMDAPAYTFYSDLTAPRPGAAAPNACASRVPGAPPSPDAVIGATGASRPDAFDMIACAEADLAATRLHGAPGKPWGTSRNVIDALVAQEDRGFWTRRGVDFRELAAAAVANVVSGRGASNLSMQIIKNLYKSDREPTWYRSLYERTHQAELEAHLRERLARRFGVSPGEVSREDMQASILSLYLQAASRDTPDPDSSAAQHPCGVDSASLARLDCVELFGVARQARRFYGKRLDQLTIAEAASIVAGLRGGRYRIDAPEDDRTESCAELRGELKRGSPRIWRDTGGVFNNRCMAERVIMVMANDPEILKQEDWFTRTFFPRKPLYIPLDQLPDEMTADHAPFITPAQESDSMAELKHLAHCGGDNRADLDINGRRRWCDVADDRGAVKNLTTHFIDWLKTQVPVPRQGHANLAVYTTLDPDAQRAAVGALAAARSAAAANPAGPPPPTLMALVTVNAEGEVKALTGPAAAGAGGLPGSTIKPFVIATYLQGVLDQEGAEAAELAFEAPVWANDCSGIPAPYVPGIGWPKANGDGCSKPRAGQALAWLPDNAAEQGERGFLGGCNGTGSSVRGSLHEALCRSLNTVTAEVAIALTRDPIAGSMDRLGVRFFDEKRRAGHFPEVGWSQSVIGEGGGTILPLDLAGAYTIFLNEGRRAAPRGVRESFEVAQGGDAPPVGIDIAKPAERAVFAPEVVRLVDRALTDVVASRHGTASALNLEAFGVAGKTGTVEGDGVTKPRDIWFAGYHRGDHPEVTVVWLSYYYPRKDGLPPNVGKIKSLYGRDVASIYKAYLEARAAPRQAGAP
jgi:membrane peptidoglycan carboxypeptidase